MAPNCDFFAWPVLLNLLLQKKDLITGNSFGTEVTSVTPSVHTGSHDPKHVCACLLLHELDEYIPQYV